MNSAVWRPARPGQRGRHTSRQQALLPHGPTRWRYLRTCAWLPEAGGQHGRVRLACMHVLLSARPVDRCPHPLMFDVCQPCGLCTGQHFLLNVGCYRRRYVSRQRFGRSTAFMSVCMWRHVMPAPSAVLQSSAKHCGPHKDRTRPMLSACARIDRMPPDVGHPDEHGAACGAHSAHRFGSFVPPARHLLPWRKPLRWRGWQIVHDETCQQQGGEKRGKQSSRGVWLRS